VYFPSWQWSASSTDAYSHRAAAAQFEAGMSQDILGGQKGMMMFVGESG